MIYIILDQVFLNRGNHEDFAVCCAYGFQIECRTKYDNITFGMFVQIFHNLPLLAIINYVVMVVHGGLFHSQDVTIDELNSINRQDFTLCDLHLDAASTDAVNKEYHDEYMRQLQRDALWSDPTLEMGLHINPRGAGVGFGPDVTKAFLERNGLKFVVRSHECVPTGFEKPFKNLGLTTTTAGAATTIDGMRKPAESNIYENMMCTVFSASNYSGGGNTAAYLVFAKTTHKIISTQLKEVHYIDDTDLMYSVNYFY